MDKVRFDVWLIWPQTDHTAIKSVSGPVIIVIDCSTFPGESKTVKPLPTILCPYFCAICIHCLTSTLWHSVFSSTLFFLSNHFLFTFFLQILLILLILFEFISSFFFLNEFSFTYSCLFFFSLKGVNFLLKFCVASS